MGLGGDPCIDQYFGFTVIMYTCDTFKTITTKWFFIFFHHIINYKLSRI